MPSGSLRRPMSAMSRETVACVQLKPLACSSSTSALCVRTDVPRTMSLIASCLLFLRFNSLPQLSKPKPQQRREPGDFGYGDMIIHFLQRGDLPLRNLSLEQPTDRVQGASCNWPAFFLPHTTNHLAPTATLVLVFTRPCSIMRRESESANDARPPNQPGRKDALSRQRWTSAPQLTP